MWYCQQDDDGDEIDDDLVDVGDDVFDFIYGCEGLQDVEQEVCGYCVIEGFYVVDYYDDEGQNQEVYVYVIVGWQDWCVYDVCKVCDDSGDVEDDGEVVFDIDVQQVDCFMVMYFGVDDYVVGGELQEGEDEIDDGE